VAPRLTTGLNPVPGPSGPGIPPYTSQTITVQPKAAPTDPFNGMTGFITYAGGNPGPWSIGAGSLLVIDRGTPNEEVVQVTSVAPAVNPTTFTADFQREHAAGFSITMHGNPGPQPLFDPRNSAYAPVVPYFAVLE
jgi:hypothetical protein